MGKISVICATPPKPNPGMASVDFAFYALSRRYGFETEVNFYQLYTSEELHAGRKVDEYDDISSRQKLPFDYVCFRDRLEEICESDAIVFWGDFLHMSHYHEAVARILCKLKVASNFDEGLEIANRHFFLTESSREILSKVLVFGGTLMFNRASDYQNETYNKGISPFLGSVCSVRMRDVYSALKVAQLRDDYNRSCLGLDCSLLLQPDDLEMLPRGLVTRDPDFGRGKVGVFFGRSDCHPKVLGKFARDFCQTSGMKAQWLSWGNPKSFGGMRRKIRRYFQDMESTDFSQPPMLGDLFELIGRYEFIITDTYHVCLNAWRMGVPAICIGQALPSSDWSVNSGSEFAWRDKRQVFYSMYDAMDFYVYAEEIANRSSRKRRIQHLTKILEDDSLPKSIVSRIHRQADQVRESFVEDLNRLRAK